jgi:hypothetical protein
MINKEFYNKKMLWRLRILRIKENKKKENKKNKLNKQNKNKIGNYKKNKSRY